jgi:hypothetical protein
MTPPYPEVKTFVQRTLGCSCPEEVFDRIAVDSGAGEVSHRIRIGGRLLVYILEASRASDISSAVAAALQEGVRERDRDHFNRLRARCRVAQPRANRRDRAAAFSSSPARDEKTHLHVLETRNLGFA